MVSSWTLMAVASSVVILSATLGFVTGRWLRKRSLWSGNYLEIWVSDTTLTIISQLKRHHRYNTDWQVVAHALRLYDYVTAGAHDGKHLALYDPKTKAIETPEACGYDWP